MKTLKPILIFFLIHLLFSCEKKCKDEGDQAQYSFFFIFKDKATDKDFFDINAKYPINMLKTLGQIADFQIEKVNNFNRIEWINHASRIIYIDYGNGDIDTLQQTWEPDEKKSKPPLKCLKELKILFNGESVQLFDFKNTPGLFQELAERNCGRTCVNWKNDPIIIEIIKKPEL